MLMLTLSLFHRYLSHYHSSQLNWDTSNPQCVLIVLISGRLNPKMVAAACKSELHFMRITTVFRNNPCLERYIAIRPKIQSYCRLRVVLREIEEKSQDFQLLPSILDSSSSITCYLKSTITIYHAFLRHGSLHHLLFDCLNKIFFGNLSCLFWLWSETKEIHWSESIDQIKNKICSRQIPRHLAAALSLYNWDSMLIYYWSTWAGPAIL